MKSLSTGALRITEMKRKAAREREGEPGENGTLETTGRTRTGRLCQETKSHGWIGQHGRHCVPGKGLFLRFLARYRGPQLQVVWT